MPDRAAFAEAGACGTIIGNPWWVAGARWKEQSMGAQRLRRRIVWLLAVAALGVGAIVGASVAAADETAPDQSPATTDDGGAAPNGNVWE
jgi:hypothetical protein